MNGPADLPSDETFEELYKRYGRPLEGGHHGEYVAISLMGQTVLGKTLVDVSQRALAELGPGSLVFKVGDASTGTWR